MKYSFFIIVSSIFLLSNCVNNNGNHKQDKTSEVVDPYLFLNFKSGMTKQEYEIIKTKLIDNSILNCKGDYIFSPNGDNFLMKITPEFNQDFRLNKIKLSYEETIRVLETHDMIIDAYVNKYGEPSNFEEMKQEFFRDNRSTPPLFNRWTFEQEYVRHPGVNIVWKTSSKVISLQRICNIKEKEIFSKNFDLPIQTEFLRYLTIIYQSTKDYENDQRLEKLEKDTKDSIKKEKIKKSQNDI
jgi:hypothetical protein